MVYSSPVRVDGQFVPLGEDIVIRQANLNEYARPKHVSSRTDVLAGSIR